MYNEETEEAMKIHEMSLNQIEDAIKAAYKRQCKIVDEQLAELQQIHLEYPKDYPIEWFEEESYIRKLIERENWLRDKKAQIDLKKVIKSFQNDLSNSGKAVAREMAKIKAHT